MKSLSIVIPAYNEGHRISNVLRDIGDYFPSAEVIVVDDGSMDNTAEVINAILPLVTIIHNGTNQGKGYSVRRGMLQASGDYVCFMDADNATPVTEMCRLIKAMDGIYSMSIGSRRLAVADVKMPVIRRISESIFNWTVKSVTGLPYRDTQCGFKLFTKVAAIDIFSQITDNGFGFDVELLLKAKSLGCEVA